MKAPGLYTIQNIITEVENYEVFCGHNKSETKQNTYKSIWRPDFSFCLTKVCQVFPKAQLFLFVFSLFYKK